jgi:hypothetical protein
MGEVIFILHSKAGGVPRRSMLKNLKILAVYDFPWCIVPHGLGLNTTEVGGS